MQPDFVPAAVVVDSALVVVWGACNDTVMWIRIVSVLLVVLILAGVAVFFFMPEDETIVARRQLIGTWQGVKDPDQIRDFRADGTVFGAQGGAPLEMRGRWALFTEEALPEGVVGEFADGVYIALKADGEPLIFMIDSIDETRLRMTHRNGRDTVELKRLAR